MLLPAAMLVSPGVALAFAFVPGAGSEGYHLPLPEERPGSYRTEQLADGPAAGWRTRIDRRTGAVHAAWGGDLTLAAAIRDTESAAALARTFLVGQSELLHTVPEQTVLRSAHHAGGKFAVWFDQEIG